MAIEQNISGKEQAVRCWSGIIFLLVAIFLGNTWLLLAGAILVATAKYKWCPIYSLLKKNSSKTA